MEIMCQPRDCAVNLETAQYVRTILGLHKHLHNLEIVQAQFANVMD